MAKQRIIIPSGSLTNEEMEVIAGKLFMCFYSVHRGRVTEGENKGAKYIEFWREEDKQ